MSDLATLPREVYRELWAGLDELEENYGKSARVTVAREWLKQAAQEKLEEVATPQKESPPGERRVAVD